jgi:galactokinase
MTVDTLLKKFDTGAQEGIFRKMYGNKPGVMEFQTGRYKNLLMEFDSRFPGMDNISVFSTPGRTEVGGNHTDHNAGRVLAAAIDLDLAAVASPAEDGRIIIHSKGYDEISMDTLELDPVDSEKYTSLSLVRGVCARLKELGFAIGGFRAVIDGRVPKGSGLSSSAAFEVMVGSILNHLYNRGGIDLTTQALAAQFAENNYFGKPSGLMDQTACAYGGLVTIDFKDPGDPQIRKLEFNFAAEGYTLMIIDTGGDHSDLNEDYASVEKEMKSVARQLGGKVLREFSRTEILENIGSLRGKVSDRALLRALHFQNDNQRVAEQVQALEAGRIRDFLRLVRESGESSWMLNQNCYSERHIDSQGISLALALTAQVLKEGAWRVHGGGFAGTVQVFVPEDSLNSYREQVQAVFGQNACHEIFIRPVGTAKLEV